MAKNKEDYGYFNEYGKWIPYKINNFNHMPKSQKRKCGKEKRKKVYTYKEWYSVRRLLGYNWARFIMCIGPRECGKSYSVMHFLVKKWKEKGIPFTWIRLSEESLKRMLANDGMDFVDADIVREFNLDLHTKGDCLYDGDKLMCRGMTLSAMAKDKGRALFDKDFLKNPDMWYHIAIDEFNRERQEKRYFNVAYNFVNQIENLIRSTKTRIRIFMMANQLEEASDILASCFNFIPYEYGTYKLKKKYAVIDYIEPNKVYLERRETATANVLAAQESTFTNLIQRDHSLIYKGRLTTPSYIIAFGKKSSEQFTVWQGQGAANIVCPYNGEKVNVIAMRPYIDQLFNKKNKDNVYTIFNARGYRFRNLITQTNFRAALEELKPNQ